MEGSSERARKKLNNETVLSRVEDKEKYEKQTELEHEILHLLYNKNIVPFSLLHQRTRGYTERE